MGTANPDKAAFGRARAHLNKKPDADGIYGTIRGMRHDPGNVKHEDRACALIAASLIEQALEEGILSHCDDTEPDLRKRLFEGDVDSFGPLGTFGAKILMARALNVIGPRTAEGLKKARTIRNLFAHTKEHIDFDTAEVSALCSFPTDNNHFWGGLAGPAPETAKEKFLAFLELVATHLAIWDTPKKRKLYLEETFGQRLG